MIGVTAGGKHRAYVVRAFDDKPIWHVVNDLLGGVPVTVTSCDRCDCVRTVTGREPGIVLDVSVAGWTQDQMLLHRGNVFFMQQSGRANSAEIRPSYPHERTT